MTSEVLSDVQRNLQLAGIRDIFHQVDELSADRLSDREIFRLVWEKGHDYTEGFVRWLVRHTLHPESEDDLMPDEVVEETSVRTQEGYSVLRITLQRIPPGVRCFYLLQYRQQFWHLVEVDSEACVLELRPLASYEP